MKIEMEKKQILMSGLVTFIKDLNFDALKQTQPKTNRAKGSTNKTNC